ncbi:hypothetical protein DSO57_1006589 [Entomophthora muscae]|uniref:Uncharacterized protein n=1 Tax=Entomophthora muscae TaxID=34485 RepID=A0ACC2SKW8_9FUNG|nr:hypothetical protein DSO57_1006589 [Entomophthora muscae]
MDNQSQKEKRLSPFATATYQPIQPMTVKEYMSITWRHHAQSSYPFPYHYYTPPFSTGSTPSVATGPMGNQYNELGKTTVQ